MDYAALRTEILSGGFNLTSRDPEVIASAVSVGRTRLVQTEIGNGVILETIGLVAGNTLLGVIYGSPDFIYVKPLLEQGRLRIDSAMVRGVIDGLTGTVLTAEQATALKNLAVMPDPISEYDVRCAMWAADGTWLGA